MTWDITGARLRIGLTSGDTSKDAELQVTMNTALAIAEKYCDRVFLQRTETAKFYHTHSNVFQLRRYPIVSVTSITGHTGEKVHHTGGWIEYDHIVTVKELVINYVGGYSALPIDLELAMWGIFDKVHAEQISTGGGGISGGVKKVAVTGVGSIDYDTGSTSSSSSGGSSYGGLIPAMAMAILDLYRLESA